jgi:hypothetical protein
MIVAHTLVKRKREGKLFSDERAEARRQNILPNSK